MTQERVTTHKKVWVSPEVTGVASMSAAEATKDTISSVESSSSIPTSGPAS